MPKRLVSVSLGDPAGIGPEVALRASLTAAAREPLSEVRPVLVGERAALEAIRGLVPEFDFDCLVPVESPTRAQLLALPAAAVPLVDPVGERRAIRFGESTAADAAAALAAVDAAFSMTRSGLVDAMITAPLSKASIARHVRSGFVGHTEYLAEACGVSRYGADYLMAFLAPTLQVALLTVHVPLRRAIDALASSAITDALACLARHAGGRIAVAGLDPHAGEGGLLGTIDRDVVGPAVEEARRRGIDAHGPESADSLFARAAGGEFDWVLALYHDQGLIAVKTASFGRATNWTLGLPILRTSVDHGTAFPLAGTGRADAAPMHAVFETTADLLAGRQPRRRAAVVDR